MHQPAVPSPGSAHPFICEDTQIWPPALLPLSGRAGAEYKRRPKQAPALAVIAKAILSLKSLCLARTQPKEVPETLLLQGQPAILQNLLETH